MNKDMLEGHVFIHTGVKEFKCDLCEKEFQYKKSLKSHQKEKHASELSSMIL